MMEISSNIVDLERRLIYPGRIVIENGRIKSIVEQAGQYNHYIIPGFIDAHIHIESSMVTPLEFSKIAVQHGTVSVVSDPHEIANVLGEDGIKYMIDNSRKSPLKIVFGVPSCVPATTFESTGAEINVNSVKRLFEYQEVKFLSEVMNYPGVINGDREILEKIEIARNNNYPIDGHAPGLAGEDLDRYIAVGISTDHECFSLEEAEEKIMKGMKILIREGSAAKNFPELIPLIEKYSEKVMFCSDDLHPDDLLKGHINLLVKRAISRGYDLFDVLRASSYNVIEHYDLNVGLVRKDDPADFILVDNLRDFNVLSTVIDGIVCYSNNEVNIEIAENNYLNRFKSKRIDEDALMVEPLDCRIKVIEVIEDELITKQSTYEPKIVNNRIISDTNLDILKIAVFNRYSDDFLKPGLGFIHGFKFKKGAIASSIAHDSHNVICVGTNDSDMTEIVNWIFENKGGIAVHDGKSVQGLPLEIGGIISNKDVYYVAKIYEKLTKAANKCGCPMKSPFMTLSFMALLVIPELKLSDKGLFDSRSFNFTSIYDSGE